MNLKCRTFAPILAGSSWILTIAVVPALAQNCSDNPVFQIHNENVDVTKKQAAEYKPGLRNFYVRDFNDNQNIYLKAAISANQRREWFSIWKDPSVPKCLAPVLDELAAIARKTLPSYRPTGFNVRNAAEEALLRNAVTNIADLKVIAGGFTSNNWQIEHRGNGIPRLRYRNGMLYVKNPKHDDGFCRIVHVNLVQDYSGGGTYGATRPAFIKSEPAGCP